MEFNTLVKAELYPILQKYGFDISKEYKNIVRFQSTKIEINIVFNNYEKSNYISIGRKNEILYPLSNNAIRIIFNSDLHIELVTSEIFVQNLSVIFQQKEGIEILKGNINYLVEFIEKEINDYNLKIMHRQTLEIASKAWARNDYKAFIKSMDEIDIEKVSKSYQLKYQIAKQKLY
jgi:hypothetical protein